MPIIFNNLTIIIIMHFLYYNNSKIKKSIKQFIDKLPEKCNIFLASPKSNAFFGPLVIDLKLMHGEWFRERERVRRF